MGKNKKTKKEIIESANSWISRISMDSKKKYDKDYILYTLHDIIGIEYIKTLESYMSIHRIVEIFEEKYKLALLERRTLYVSDLYEELLTIDNDEFVILPYNLYEFNFVIKEIVRKNDLDYHSSKCFDIIKDILKTALKESMPDDIMGFKEKLKAIIDALESSEHNKLTFSEKRIKKLEEKKSKLY